MVDLAPDIEIRNYGLRKTPSIRMLCESMKILLPLLLIAGAVSFNIRIRSENIHIGYQKRQLSVQEKDERNIQQQLIVEERMLKDQEWLEASIHKGSGMILLATE